MLSIPSRYRLICAAAHIPDLASIIPSVTHPDACMCHGGPHLRLVVTLVCCSPSLASLADEYHVAPGQNNFYCMQYHKQTPTCKGRTCLAFDNKNDMIYLDYA